jgi:hypothetical protein
MAVTLPLQTLMSITTNMSSTPRHRTVEFGDGYIQRTPLGIHAQRRRITVVHPHLGLSDGDTIVNFYTARHFDGDSIEIDSNTLFINSGKFYLESFDIEMSDDDRRTITAQMIEVFDV